MEARRGKRTIGKRRRGRQVAVRPRAQRSLYDNDALIKVSWRVPLLSAASGNPSYIQMRTDLATSAAPDYSWIDAADYQPFHPLYQLCEVRGIKMEVTIGNYVSTGNKIINAATIYGGPAADVPTGATPSVDRSQGLPVSVPVNLQGQRTSAYFNVSTALKAAGMPLSTQRTISYPTETGYCMFVLLNQFGFALGDTLGEVVMTWYIRLHQRKYVG